MSTIGKNKTKINSFINHETYEALNSSIQKTSITINSDACLSTVNVNDHVKIYHHSSVLIKNNLDQIDNRGCQKEFEKYINNKNEEKPNISENISENSSTEIAILCHDKNNDTAKNIDILEIVSKNMKKTKTLICLDYANSSLNDEGFSKENTPSEFSIKNKEPDDQSYNNLRTSKFLADSFILRLLNDPYLSALFYGLEITEIANIIENSLVRLRVDINNFVS